jgi:hypothetical protein
MPKQGETVETVVVAFREAEFTPIKGLALPTSFCELFHVF